MATTQTAADIDGPVQESFCPLSLTPPFLHNSQLTISRLPPEILASVFIFQADSERSQLQAPDGRRRRGLRWIAASHVCRSWRHAALAYASVWAYIPFSLGQEWIDEAFYRAGSVPLVLHYEENPTAKNAAWLVKFVAQNLSRTRSLCLHMTPVAYRAFLSTNPLGTAAPYLEELELHNGDARSPAQKMRPITLGDFAPRLRRFTLRSGFMDIATWTRLPLANLQSLELGFWSLWPGHIPNDGTQATMKHLQELHGALRQMPVLEDISLSGVLPFTWPPSVEVHTAVPPPAIALSRLARLSVSFAYLTPLSLFLAPLVLPANVKIILDVRPSPSQIPPDIISATAHLAKLILSIAQSAPRPKELTIAPVQARNAIAVCTSSATLSLNWSCGKATEAMRIDALISGAWQALASPALEELRLDDSQGMWTAETWRAFSSVPAPALRTLTVSGRAVVGACAALHEPLPSAEPWVRDTGALMFPALTTLVLEKPLVLPEDKVALAPEAVPTAMFSARAARGRGLRTVTVIQCQEDRCAKSAGWLEMLQRWRSAEPGLVTTVRD